LEDWHHCLNTYGFKYVRLLDPVADSNGKYYIPRVEKFTRGVEPTGIVYFQDFVPYIFKNPNVTGTTGYDYLV
jgi:hypothetical protein